MRPAFWITLALTGLLIKWPYHNLMLLLVQGDIGRELYIYEQTLQGAIIYRDYNYQYGPIMPYYYALFIKMLGTQVSSVLIGHIVLGIIAGLLLAGCLLPLAGATAAILGALWFWCFHPAFFHTFNHSGAVTGILLTLYYLIRFSGAPSKPGAWAIAGAILLVLLIKFNIGLALWLGIILCIFIQNRMSGIRIPQNILKALPLILAAPVVLSIAIYALLLIGLPWYHIQQCFVFDPAYRVFPQRSLWSSTGELINRMLADLGGQTHETDRMSKMPAVLPHRIFFLIMLGSMAMLLRNILLQRKTIQPLLKQLTLPACLLVLILLLSHEYFSGGYYYHRFWVIPLVIMLAFALLAMGLNGMSRRFRQLTWLAISGVILLEIQGKYSFEYFIKSKPQQFMSYPKVNVFIHNSPAWISTVSQTTDYLKAHLKKDETFFALPFDPLYYYLTGRRAPVREIILFNHMHIPPEQEMDIIRSLKKQKTQYILISNRSDNPPDDAFGKFGVSYGVLLARFIAEHYEPAAAFGEWTPRPDWTDQHAVRIYRLKGQ